MKRIFMYFLFLVALNAAAFAQVTGDYGSAVTTGNWSAAGSWVIFNTAPDWSDATPAATAPTTTSNVFIRSSHTITFDPASVTVATLTVNSGGILTMTMTANKTLNAEILINGTFNGSGGFSINTTGNITCSGPSARLTFGSNNGKFVGVAGKTFTLSNGAFLQTSNNTGPLTSVVTNMTWVIDNSVALTTISIKTSGNTSIVNPPNSQVFGNLQLTCSSGAAGKNFVIGDYLTMLGDFTVNQVSSSGTVTWDFQGYTVTTTGANKTASALQGTAGTATIIKASGPTFLNGFTTVNMVPPANANCTVQYASATAQTIAGGAYQHLTLSAGTKSISANTTIKGTLTLADGFINTGSNTLTLDTLSSISRTTGHVIGNLAKRVVSGATTKTFEIGDGTNYTPILVDFTNVSVGGVLTAKTTATAHPELSSSGINPLRCATRYWTLSNSGITLDSYNATFNFVAGDVIGGAFPSAFIGKLYSGSAWGAALTMGTLTSTSSQVTGVTSYGDFAVGEAATASPVIGITGSAMNFGYIPVGGTSSELSYSVSGNNLTAAITIAPPAGFQISTGTGGGFVATDPILLTPSGGTVPATTIYARFVPGSAGAYSGNISHSSTTASGTIGVSGTTIIAAEPTVASSAIAYSGYASTSLTIQWTPGNGSGHLVLVKGGSAVSSNPADGISYTANTTFGSGSQVGSGNYVVYNAGGSSVTVTGLTSGVFYYVTIFEFNGSAGSENYLTSSTATSHPIAAGSVSAVGSGLWSSTAVWSSGSVPTLSTNIVIPNTFTVTVDNLTSQSCNNLTVENGGRLIASGSNITSGASKTLRIYGSSIYNYGTIGAGPGIFDTTGLRFDFYNSSVPVVLSGTGTTMVTKLIPAAAVQELRIAQNVSVSYQASTTGGGAGWQFANSSANYFALSTVTAGNTLTFGNYTNFNTSSSSTADAPASWTCDIYGTVNCGANSNINLCTDATHTGTFNIKSGGVVNVGSGFNPSRTANVTVFTVDGTLNLSATGTADFSVNPAQTITGSGTVVLPAGGTIKLANAEGLNSTTGVIRVPVRSFSSGAIYNYSGTVAQVTGPDLPETVKNLIVYNPAGISLSADVTVDGLLYLSKGQLTLNGNVLSYGSLGGVRYSDSTLQTTSDVEFPAANGPKKFYVDNINGVALHASRTITDTLYLVTGKLYLQNNTLTLSPTATAAGAVNSTKCIVLGSSGELRKEFSAPGTFVFQLGEETGTAEASPVKLIINSGTFNSAYVSAKVTNAKHPNNPSTTDFLNRYWTLTSSGLTAFNADVKMTYPSADVNGTLAKIVSGKWDGSAWTGYEVVDTVASTDTLEANGVTSFSDFTGGDGVSMNAPAPKFTLKLIPEGYLDIGTNTLNISDTFKVMLANTTSPFAFVDSATFVLDKLSLTGSGQFTSANGNYYAVLKGRNTLETWSRAGGELLVKGGTLNYDFTTAADKAYGSNQAFKASKYCIFSGDVNQDGIVDFTDLVAIDNDQYNFVGGYVPTDITGDDFVDFSDLSLCDNNQFNFISVSSPAVLKRKVKPIRIEKASVGQ